MPSWASSGWGGCSCPTGGEPSPGTEAPEVERGSHTHSGTDGCLQEGGCAPGVRPLLSGCLLGEFNHSLWIAAPAGAGASITPTLCSGAAGHPPMGALSSSHRGWDTLGHYPPPWGADAPAPPLIGMARVTDLRQQAHRATCPASRTEPGLVSGTSRCSPQQGPGKSVARGGEAVSRQKKAGQCVNRG